jgi:pyruvate/2-oxoglutarate dehydrogenase complex dihydrolipoamide acyltransferase (E2) component
MITRLTVPHLDANILDVTLTAWRKAPGESIRQGEIVAELTTDKATFELEATGSGTLLEILAAPKSVIPSGYILALVGNPGETDPAATRRNRELLEKYRADSGQPRTTLPPPAAPATPAIPPAIPPATFATLATPAGRVRATPKARRLAQEQGLDLARIQAETGAEVVDESVLLPYLKKS